MNRSIVATMMLILSGISPVSGLKANTKIEDRVNAQQVNRSFAVLLVVQWLVALVLAVFKSPDSGGVPSNLITRQVCYAFIWGGLIVFVALCFIILAMGDMLTRYVVSASQTALSGLILYLADLPDAAPFYLMGTVLLLSLYRDFRVILTALGIALIWVS